MICVTENGRFICSEIMVIGSIMFKANFPTGNRRKLRPYFDGILMESL